MGDLIDRAALKTAIRDYANEPVKLNDRRWNTKCTAIIEDMIGTVNSAPTIEAVPLDKLCEWLEAYARTPIYNLHHTAEWWKESLTKWMEGLDAAFN